MQRNIVSALKELKSLGSSYSNNAFIASIEELESKIKEEKINVVVLGLFKRGKSSLINALLKKSLLPAAVTPVTAIVTLLHYHAEENFIEIEFKNGRKEIRNISEINLYVSEEENPRNKKHVEVIRLFDHSPLLEKIILADTPGLGSAFEHNTETTLRFIPKIDAGLFVLSADMPVSKMDIEFLYELDQITPTIVFVLNKADLLKEKELQKILQHNKEIISSVLKKDLHDITFFAVSSKDEKPENIDSLRDKILSLAEKDKHKILHQSAVRQYQSLKNQLTSFLQLRLDSLRMPLHELERRQDQFRSSLSLLQEQKEEFQNITNGKIKNIDHYIHISVNNIRKEIDKEIDLKLETVLLGKSIGADKKAIYHLQKEINQLVISRFITIKGKMETETKEHFHNLLQQYVSRSQSFLNELAKNLSALMGLDFELIVQKFDLNVYTSFYLTLEGGEQPIDFSNNIMNKFLSKAKKEKNTLRRIKEHFHAVINTNTASVIYDLQYKIQESFRKFNYDLNNHLGELIDSIENILKEIIQKKNKTAAGITEEAEEIKKRITAVQQME